MSETWMEELATVAEALSELNRIRILVQLREPRAIRDLELKAVKGSKWGPADRPLSPQAVTDHVEHLSDLGLVVPAGPDERGRARYVIDRTRLFLALEALRRIGTLPGPDREAGDETLEGGGRVAYARPHYPHMMVAHGMEEGTVIPLAGQQPEGGWLIGRGEGAHIRLPYDPRVSRQHAVILRDGAAYYLVPVDGTDNVTRLNGATVLPRKAARLQSGDIVGVGWSGVMFRDASTL